MEKEIILDSLKKQFSGAVKDFSVQFGECIIRIEKKSLYDLIIGFSPKSAMFPYCICFRTDDTGTLHR